jgi:hypothetical protein
MVPGDPGPAASSSSAPAPTPVIPSGALSTPPFLQRRCAGLPTAGPMVVEGGGAASSSSAPASTPVIPSDALPKRPRLQGVDLEIAEMPLAVERVSGVAPPSACYASYFDAASPLEFARTYGISYGGIVDLKSGYNLAGTATQIVAHAEVVELDPLALLGAPSAAEGLACSVGRGEEGRGGGPLAVRVQALLVAGLEAEAVPARAAGRAEEGPGAGA